MSDAGGVRGQVRALRRRLAWIGFWILPVMAAEGVLSWIEGSGATIWIVLVAVFLPFWILGQRLAAKREVVLFAQDDATVAAYLARRLEFAAPEAHRFGPWVWIGAAFVAVGFVDLMPPRDPNWLAGAAGDWLLGVYFIAWRLHGRFVAAPRMRAEAAALRDVPPPDVAAAKIEDLVRAVHGALGEVQAIALRREVTGESGAQAKERVRGLALAKA